MGPGLPIWAAEETEGQLSWVPGSFRDDSRAGLGNLDLKELPTEICFLSTRTGTLDGERCALGPCPCLSGQRVTFICRDLQEHHYQTSETNVLTPRSLQQLTTPIPQFLLLRGLAERFH